MASSFGPTIRVSKTKCVGKPIAVRRLPPPREQRIEVSSVEGRAGVEPPPALERFCPFWLTVYRIQPIIGLDAGNLHCAFQPLYSVAAGRAKTQTPSRAKIVYISWGHPMSKILVVEDSPEFSEMLVAVLQAEGHSVMTAEDGLQAITQVEVWNPDL